MATQPAKNAIPSQGVSLRRGNGADPEVFTHIAHIKSFAGPSGGASIINTSTLDSEAVEKLMGLLDEGTFTFRANAMPQDGGQVALRADRAQKVLRSFQLVLTDADATTLTFAAYVRELPISGETDGIVELAGTLEISGPVDWGD